MNFMYVRRSDFHKNLYAWVDYLGDQGEFESLTWQRWHEGFSEIVACRYINGVPLWIEDHVVMVNWGEVTITHRQTGQLLHHKAFITDQPITEQMVESIIAARPEPLEMSYAGKDKAV